MNTQLNIFIKAINAGPISWGMQKEFVELILSLLQDIEVQHNAHVDKLQLIISNLKEQTEEVRALQNAFLAD